MFYFYSIFIPISIIILGFYLEGKPSKKSDIVTYLFKILKTLVTYSLLLYYLESEHIINSSWAFYSVMFFLIPFGLVIIPLKLYYFLKRDKEPSTRPRL